MPEVIHPVVHVTLACSDLAASRAFYAAALGADADTEFGDEEEDDPATEAIRFLLPGAVLWLVAGPVATSAAHLSLPVDSPDLVRAAFDAGRRAGGTVRREPRRWPIYAAGQFTAALEDPDGNVLELVAPEAG